MKTNQNTLIILDIDNTINNKNLNGEIYLIKEFVELHDKVSQKENIKIAYNTTRGISRVLEMLKTDREYFGSGILSVLNGALTYDLNKRQQLSSHSIGADVRKSLSDWFNSTEDITFMAFYSDNDIYGYVYLKDAELVDEFFRLHEFSFNHDRSRCISDRGLYASWIEEKTINMIEFKTSNEDATKKSLMSTNVSLSFDGHYYVNAKSINKGSGTQDIKKILFNENDVIRVVVAGDSSTDLAMFDNSNYMNIAVGEKIQIPDLPNYTKVESPKELCNFLCELLNI